MTPVQMVVAPPRADTVLLPGRQHPSAAHFERGMLTYSIQFDLFVASDQGSFTLNVFLPLESLLSPLQGVRRG